MSRLSMHYTTTRPWPAIARRWIALPVVLLFAFIVVDMPLAAQTENGKQDKPSIYFEEYPDNLDEANHGEDQENKVYRIVDEMPKYPGGMDALYKLINENITYPESCRADSIQGTVFIQFIVDKEGNVRDIESLRSPHEYLTKESIRVLGLMPRWTPGRQRGEAVDAYYNLPIRFMLE